MSKFLKILNKYSSILNEEENGVIGGEPDATNPEVGGESPMDDTTGAEQDLGNTDEAIPEIGDQDLVDIAKVLIQYVNSSCYDSSNKENLSDILKGIENVDVAQENSSKKIKEILSSFVAALRQNPAKVISKDSTL
jgi:hypothetical protein